MVRLTTFILSLAFLIAGILGLTNLLPIFELYPVYANLGAIVLGILGMLIVIYVRRGGETAAQKRALAREREENERLRKEAAEQSKRETEQLRTDIAQLLIENEQQRNIIEQHTLHSSSETII